MFKDGYGDMSKAQLKTVTDEMFAKFDSQGRKMPWMAEQFGVSRQTVYKWKEMGAPIYALRILKLILVGKFDLNEMLDGITEDNKHKHQGF